MANLPVADTTEPFISQEIPGHDIGVKQMPSQPAQRDDQDHIAAGGAKCKLDPPVAEIGIRRGHRNPV